MHNKSSVLLFGAISLIHLDFLYNLQTYFTFKVD